VTSPTRARVTPTTFRLSPSRSEKSRAIPAPRKARVTIINASSDRLSLIFFTIVQIVEFARTVKRRECHPDTSNRQLDQPPYSTPEGDHDLAHRTTDVFGVSVTVCARTGNRQNIIANASYLSSQSAPGRWRFFFTTLRKCARSRSFAASPPVPLLFVSFAPAAQLHRGVSGRTPYAPFSYLMNVFVVSHWGFHNERTGVRR
jgi:hypothetical protein